MNEISSFAKLNRPTPESHARDEARKRESARTELEDSITKAHEIDTLCRTLRPGDWREGYNYASAYVDILKNLLTLAVDRIQRDPLTQAMTPSSLELYEDILATNEFIAGNWFSAYRTLTNDFTSGCFTAAITEGFRDEFTIATDYTIQILGFTDIHESQQQQIVAYAFAEQPSESLQINNYIKLADTETRGKMVRYAIREYLPELGEKKYEPFLVAGLGQAISECIVDPSNNDENSEDTINALLEYIGPEMRDIMSAWQTKGAQHNGDDSDYVNTCLASFARIWNECGKEATLKLHKQYGIRHFHYFPAKVLIEQARHKQSDPTKRFGIITIPFNDNNGAFIDMKTVIEDSWNELKDTHDIVCIETKHQAELVRQLWRTRKNYGNGRNDGLADFLILGGHGSKESIEFGTDKNHHVITSAHLSQTIHKHRLLADNVLQPDGRVILVACSTGVKGGIAQTAAAFFNRTIIGPSNNTNISDISYTRDETGKITDTIPTYWETTATFSYSPDATEPEVLVPPDKVV